MESKSSKMQYDIELGGNTKLPFSFNVEEYVSAHVNELKALTDAIENPVKTKLSFQRLPKHMRRRVMSHNVKRMPKRLREAHAKYLEKQKLKFTKRPSRKFRRRPKNLLQEYNRRQREHVWLETHIWHAKRFHMIKQWGYKIANFPNEKSYRACLRAIDRNCLLHDISYMNCIQLQGTEQALVKGLLQHTFSVTGFNINAKFYTNGSKEGHIMFYEKNQYPYNAIGQISFIWKPDDIRGQGTESKGEDKILWIWCHPSYYMKIREELINTFDLVENTVELMSVDEDLSNENVNKNVDTVKKGQRKKDYKNVEREKIALKNVPFELKVKTFCNKNDNVQMCLLKDALNRFRLTGPLSSLVIAKAFTLFDVENKKTDENKEGAGPSSLNLLKESSVMINKELKPIWDLMECATSSQFPPRCVLGAIVEDPRFSMPAQRIRNELNDCDDDDLIQLATLPQYLSRSLLWNSELRDFVSANKISTHEVNNIFANRVVPGLSNPLEKEHVVPIPITLVQQESSSHINSKKTGFGSGWDIILPTGWSMPFWLALVFNGARVGGLREIINLDADMGRPSFLQCDTTAWVDYEKEQTDIFKEKYFKKPPKQRPNYIKLGIPNPFSFPWTVLLNDWKKESTIILENETHSVEELSHSEKYYVLRDKKIKQKLNNILKTVNPFNQFDKEIKDDIPNANDCLIHINLNLISKGELNKYTQIYLPNELDVIKYNNKSKDNIKEDVHEDSNQMIRKLLKEKHKKLLNSLKRKRNKIKKKSDEMNEKRIKRKETPTADIVNSYKILNQRLWVPNVSLNNFSEGSCDGNKTNENNPNEGMDSDDIEATAQGLKRKNSSGDDFEKTEENIKHMNYTENTSTVHGCDEMEIEKEESDKCVKSNIYNKEIELNKLKDLAKQGIQNINSIRHRSSRDVIGFVTNSKQGYICLNSFIELIKLLKRNKCKKLLVLIRNSNNYNYHWADIVII